MAAAAVRDKLEDVELREEDMRWVGDYAARFVGADQLFEERDEGFDYSYYRGGANLDERGARDGDDFVLGEFLGRRAGAMGELPSREGKLSVFRLDLEGYKSSTYPRSEPLHQAVYQARIAIHCASMVAGLCLRLLMFG